MNYTKFDEKNKRWTVHYSLTDPSSYRQEVWKWCWQTFGHPGTDPESGIKSQWDYHGGWLYLYSEEALAWFKLRWS